jgi:hypothetical protein
MICLNQKLAWGSYSGQRLKSECLLSRRRSPPGAEDLCIVRGGALHLNWLILAALPTAEKPFQFEEIQSLGAQGAD